MPLTLKNPKNAARNGWTAILQGRMPAHRAGLQMESSVRSGIGGGGGGGGGGAGGGGHWAAGHLVEVFDKLCSRRLAMLIFLPQLFYLLT